MYVLYVPHKYVYASVNMINLLVVLTEWTHNKLVDLTDASMTTIIKVLFDVN